MEGVVAMVEETMVVIVGAGPSGLATSACLGDIPHVILEREDCYASLWKKRSYDRLSLHLAKEFCHLPLMPLPPKSPTYLSKKEFIEYLDRYVSEFKINSRFHQSVESASYDEVEKRWVIEYKNTLSGEVKVLVAKFLVVASGENNEGYIPNIPGLETFQGEIMHSSIYKCGLAFRDQNVLVVGSGNSGMEIAYDVSNYGALTSIVIKSSFHVLTKGMVRLGMLLLMKKLPLWLVDFIVTSLALYAYGDLTRFGIRRPKSGPFYLKSTTGRSAVIDVGTVQKIKNGDIDVVPAITMVKENSVVFENGIERQFDAIVFATGYRSLANTWLKDYKYGLNAKGLPKNSFPNHWKGENNLYVAGLSRRGLEGVGKDAIAIAGDIKKIMMTGQLMFKYGLRTSSS
ncbi:probable indole-3-pyruvate monooxygenase YUCCA10 [Tripterygium wilfordii]|uniref:probable indole-3-pyruvate monooxygenase YUCCA10 n=1 Tax=Tripterygium wilfordii TaxID=458696 RepID=UPI0018F83EC9|nr:probable indole-3-pyruvate monooxygenase YUCCA10 [Tripterygium wilfordii]